MENLIMMGSLYSEFLKSKIEESQINEIEKKVNNFVNFLIENSDSNEKKESLKSKSNNVISN